MARFHLAFPVTDLDSTETFYRDILGCAVGRRGKVSLVLRLGDAQIVAHATGEAPAEPTSIYPRHFGLIFDRAEDWESLLSRVRKRGLEVFDGPRARYQGKTPEHRTFFLKDPSGNLLEFKHYTHPEAVFGATDVSVAGDADDD